MISNLTCLMLTQGAHNCVGNNPGAKIMTNFYHPRKSKGQHIPHILGLTASPVMRSNATSLVKIEETLDAICRTPTKHRAEYVNISATLVFKDLRSRERFKGVLILEYWFEIYSRTYFQSILSSLDILGKRC